MQFVRKLSYRFKNLLLKQEKDVLSEKKNLGETLDSQK